jgi:sulfate permease, SulP family
VILGVIIAALFFAWEHAKHIECEIDHPESSVKRYKIQGPLFFSSVKYFKKLFTVESDPQEVVIEFQNSRVCDHSAIKAIDDIVKQYRKAGKQLHLCHLSEDCRHLLNKASDVIELDEKNDPHYHIAI